MNFKIFQLPDEVFSTADTVRAERDRLRAENSTLKKSLAEAEAAYRECYFLLRDMYGEGVRERRKWFGGNDPTGFDNVMTKYLRLASKLRQPT